MPIGDPEFAFSSRDGLHHACDRAASRRVDDWNA
jgi:hypothetical protein